VLNRLQRTMCVLINRIVSIGILPDTNEHEHPESREMGAYIRIRFNTKFAKLA
jgi:hypothetical protein